jgi:transcriptional antiterminator NusG
MFRWYVVNTYSGHENKVKHNLEHRVVSLGQQRAVRQIVVPTESVSEMKDNQKITVEKRTMPGYVLVCCIARPRSGHGAVPSSRSANRSR